ncbi:MAG: deoxyribose-phosphate aldolase, partial [Bacteroidota bacterium]
PMGYSSISAKVAEITRAIQKGADEIDAVINISAVKSGDWKHIKNEISSLVGATHLQRKVFKLILETSLLDNVEIAQLCAISSDAEVDFVKNATGFSGEGATIEMMRFLRTSLPNNIQIKASGGIRSYEFAQALLAAGVTRIGTSSCVTIMNEQQLVG